MKSMSLHWKHTKRFVFILNTLLTLIAAFLYTNGYAAQLPYFYERREVPFSFGVIMFLLILLAVLTQKRQASRVLLFLNAIVQCFPATPLLSSRSYAQLWDGAVCSPTLCLLLHVAIVVASVYLFINEPPFLTR